MKLVIFGILACISTAYAIKCYVCAGTEAQCSKNRLEGNKDKFLHDCGSGFDRCLRVWTKLGNVKGVTYTCANKKSCDFDTLDAACKLAKKTVDDCKASCCDEDACNDGTSASAIKCYVCTGTEDQCSKSTLKGNKDKYLKDCGSGFDRCVRVWGKVGKIKSVTNSCTNQAFCDSDNLKKVCDVAEAAGADKCKISCCDKDACNAATSVSFSFMLMIMCSLIGIAFMK